MKIILFNKVCTAIPWEPEDLSVHVGERKSQEGNQQRKDLVTTVIKSLNYIIVNIFKTETNITNE